MAAGYQHALEAAQLLTTGILEFDQHRHLALGEIQLGNILVIVPRGGDTQRVGDGLGGDA